ncbi:DUF3060 domain-containing protein [Miniimonas sp. S16]|uniref:DUF3060 domain-containing protein n=1 Tax=Miniimonas sp. S16 TaxID=2171623 RepID=UPI00131ED64F|nr:DUF3060 domain-containing protein [Miniimonas sp. S16]
MNRRLTIPALACALVLVAACSNGAPDVDLRWDGQCDAVAIEGVDLDVDLERATVQSVTVRGDRNDVDAADLATLVIEGQENDVHAQSIGSAEVRGDRNEVDVDGRLGAVVVQGNDNEIEARELGTTDDSGDRNVIRTD